MHATDIRIQPCSPNDDDELAALWAACGLVVDYNDPIQDVRFAASHPCSDVLVATNAEGRILASAMVGHDGHRGWLYYLASHPAVRGRGYGRLMVEAAEDWLRQRGVAKIQLLVRETNPVAVAFYEHLGFEVTPRTVMAKWLRDGR